MSLYYKKSGKPLTSRVIKLSRFLVAKNVHFCILNIEECHWKKYLNFVKNNNLKMAVLETRNFKPFSAKHLSFRKYISLHDYLRDRNGITVHVVRVEKTWLREKWIETLFSNLLCPDLIFHVLKYYQ